MENYFISINVPEEIGFRISNKVENQFDKTLIGKKISKDDYHITIKYLGGLNEKKLKSIKENLLRVKFDSFNIRVGKLEFFGRNNSGVLVASAKSEELKKLVKTTWGIIGWSEEKFKSHITIMRVKRILNQFKLNNIVKSLRFGNLEFDVNKFYLMKSISDKKGTRYEVVNEYNLD